MYNQLFAGFTWLSSPSLSRVGSPRVRLSVTGKSLIRASSEATASWCPVGLQVRREGRISWEYGEETVESREGVHEGEEGSDMDGERRLSTSVSFSFGFDIGSGTLSLSSNSLASISQ